MANKAQPFRQHHITRALKAYAAAGRPDATVEVRLPSGATITVGNGGKPPATDRPVQNSSRKTVGGRK